MDWRPVQGEPRLSPDDRWDRLKQIYVDHNNFIILSYIYKFVVK